ncbi:uncharacterized protein N0V89_003641 [Didymosphaeria variabile]|uniref:C3H1-type domain-containing protein n=1 Tax=Didymosphaeria variabile TaxID=1932322 RepID=A0A9W8XPP2_9PLEO|nr:uncharacterized protein N0V89_003641 [Didymosphaeria variabile]KAJ4355621.1 hypothetical protein N0V89_003641 [Didymosphaeria variabile]
MRNTTTPSNLAEPKASTYLTVKLRSDPSTTWAEIFNLQQMKDDMETAATGYGESGDYAVYLTYQKAGNTPLGSKRTYVSDFFVPLTLRPEEHVKMEIYKKTMKKRKTCRFWAMRTCRAHLAGVECEYDHPEGKGSVEQDLAKKDKMEKVWR